MSRRKGSLNDYKSRATHSLPFPVRTSHFQDQACPEQNFYQNNENKALKDETGYLDIEQIKGENGQQICNSVHKQQGTKINYQRDRAHSTTGNGSSSNNKKIIGGSKENTQNHSYSDESQKQQNNVKAALNYQQKSHKEWKEEESGRRNKSQNELLHVHSNHIQELRIEDEEQNGQKWIDESLVNQFENSSLQQEDFSENNCKEEQSSAWNQPGRACYVIPRTQYRKTAAIEQNKAFENIKEIIRRQQLNMKEYIDWRTNTDTTDDQNASNNPNNKSSSEEANPGDPKFKYDSAGIGEFQGNFIQSGFRYPQKPFKQICSKQTPARELSTSHDTTKLIIDDDQTPPQPPKHEPVVVDNYNKNSFNFTHPALTRQQLRPNLFHSACKTSDNSAQLNKSIKKNLSIISDFQQEDMLQYQMKDQQLCPRRSNSKVVPTFPSQLQYCQASLMQNETLI